MAKSKRKAGKRAGTAGRKGLRALKSCVSKARKPGLSKLKSAKTGPRKQKPFVSSETARLKRQLKGARKETRGVLERQAATSEILKIIASSPSDVQPVFDAIVGSAKRLLGSFSAAVFRLIDGNVHLAAFMPTNPVADEALKADFPQPVENFEAFRLAQHGKPFPIPDTEEVSHQPLRDIARVHGFRSMLWVPITNSGVTIGIVSVTRAEPGAFAPHHIQLLQTFADQAVIAIENARLFNETREALARQTATSEVLQVISNSMADSRPVFERILDSTMQLFDCRQSTLILAPGDGLLHVGARRGAGSEVLDRVYPQPVGETMAAIVLGKCEQTYVANVMHDSDASLSLRRVAEAFGNYSIVMTPMIWEGQGIGMISVVREPNASFNAKELSLLRTFADQAVIAIHNARMFEQVQERTRELSASLEDLRTAQDRLVQTEKLASLGQLTAGIAHEIKNPLNFVNNFSALSAELTDELNDVLKPVAMDSKVRGEVDELTGLLKDNLEKVVQHGKRADSIVKNMLLHSREGSGERRSAEINRLVEESLSLAYHGARAEKAGFTITLRHDLDPEAGALDLYPQEMTRALLNLISNGFYAATKRKAELADGVFEPILCAVTRNLGKSIEIRIRDNGTGITPEVKEKMFNPFFTTKPTGEGTGLGLSMTHDIIVKQHGGRIDVEAEPGVFTEFIITLPREKGPAAKRE